MSEVRDDHRRAVRAAMKRAGEEARAFLASSNCIDAGVCRISPCACALNALETGMKVMVEEVMIWNGGVLPDDRMEIGDLGAVLEKGLEDG